MKFVLSVSAFHNVCCLTLFASSAFLSGCAHSGAPLQVTTVAAASARTSASSAARMVSPEQAAIAHVQALPLYQQAEAACRQKRFAQAAVLLRQLAALPALTAHELAFVRQQRALCLKDAGLPVPSFALSPAVSASVRHPAVVLPSPMVSAASSATPLANADCGPRALLLLCNRLGVKTDLQTLRQKAGTTTQGTSLAGLAAAAKAVGLKAEGVQVSREALHDMELPAIAYTNGNHFILVTGVQGKEENGTATVQDPNAAGEETMPQERLLRLCSGYLLLVKR